MIIKELKTKWRSEGVTTTPSLDKHIIKLFQDENGVVLPNDFIEYILELNGTGGEPTNELFEFYSIERIKQIQVEFSEWKGIPSYKNLSEKVSEVDQLYVFANYQFNLYAYAIRLHSHYVGKNEVYVFCGNEYKIIADNFSDFLEKYVEDSEDIRI